MTENPSQNLIDPRPVSIGDFTVGRLAFGCWRFTSDSTAEAQAALETALDQGMNLVDTADVYGLDWGGTGFGSNEARLGELLAASPSLRDRMVLATKGGIVPPTPYNSGREYLKAACEASLSRLQVDVIDIYQIHRPDFFTHPAEVAAALVELHDEGKIRHIGVSNYLPTQTDALRRHLALPISVDQEEYSLSELGPLRDGVLDRCLEFGSVPLAWSPLGGGRLATGVGIPDDLAVALEALAQREGVDQATIALAFVLAHPSRPVAIIGTQNPERIAKSAEALGVALSRSDVYQLIQAAEGRPLP